MTDVAINDLIAATFTDKVEGQIVRNASYYSCVLSRCKVIENKQAQTMGVCFDRDGNVVLLYNPDFLKTLTDGQAVQILKHEALHIFFQHFTRFKGKNHERANIAEDMEINQNLEGLPKGAVYPETYGFQRGSAAEAYYMGLKDKNLFNQQAMNMKKSSDQSKSDKQKGYDDGYAQGLKDKQKQQQNQSGGGQQSADKQDQQGQQQGQGSGSPQQGQQNQDQQQSGGNQSQGGSQQDQQGQQQGQGSGSPQQGQQNQDQQQSGGNQSQGGSQQDQQGQGSGGSSQSQQGQGQQGQGGGQPNQGKGQDYQDGYDQGYQDAMNGKPQTEPSDGDGQGQGKPKPGMEGGLDNHNLHDKVVDDQGNVVGTVESEKVDTAPQLDKIHKQVIATLKNIYGSKEHGRIPGWGKQAIEADVIKSNNNWKYLLRKIIGSVLGTDKIYSQKRRDRRMLVADPKHFYPGQKYGLQPKVLCVRDTSGSMFDAELQAEVLSEIMNITKHSEVQVCDCDTEVHDCYKVKKASDFKDYQGGGGTSFVEPFKLAKKLGVQAIVYLTDLYGDFPDPGTVGKFYYNTVWVTTEDVKNAKVPFGKLVQITKKDDFGK